VNATTLEARLPHAAKPTFTEVAERELDAVYRYLVFLTHDAALAEDLAAETFEKALRAWRRFDPRRASARTWLCRIARNVALDWLRAEKRRRRREEHYAAHESETVELVWAEGVSSDLACALRELSAGDREVLALRVVLELDGPAAARVLGISQTACSTRLSRALRRLEELIADEHR
jgi:RNA polymerase sigma factor (sigma-70 family)